MVAAEAHLVRALAVLGRTKDVENVARGALARARKLGLHKLLAYALRVAGMVRRSDGDLSKGARPHCRS